MSAQREYPETDAGPFPTPPTTFEDREDRTVTIEDALEHQTGLETMYETFDPAQRAQGIPPSDPDRIGPWIATILEDGIHLVAVVDGQPVGHAMLVPDGDQAYELAIFVHQDNQGAGIGRQLLEHLLGAGEAAGIERVWLTVERWNAPAMGLYQSVGFETVRADRFDLEMALSLG